jgi:hypothetical protein
LELRLNTVFFHSGQQHSKLKKSLTDYRFFDTAHWRSVCDVTLTLKQGRQSDDGRWFRGNDHQYRAAFKHFMKRLNYAVYRNAARRYHRRLRVIPVLEKEAEGRWHIHAAVEPPAHIRFEEFKRLIQIHWREIDWAYRVDLIRPNADQGWVEYLLKLRQKSGLEHWSDCFDWDSFHNPIADA